MVMTVSFKVIFRIRRRQHSFETGFDSAHVARGKVCWLSAEAPDARGHPPTATSQSRCRNEQKLRVERSLRPVPRKFQGIYPDWN